MDANEERLFESIAKLRYEYALLMLHAFKDGLAAVKEAVSTGKYIGNYYNFPELKYKDNGLPELSSFTFNGPIEYRRCFGSLVTERLINENEIESFNELVDFVRANPRLQDRFVTDNWNDRQQDTDIEIDSIFIKAGVKDSIERYIHLNGTFDYEEEKAREAIGPTEAYIFEQFLSIEINIPILFVNFEFDSHEICEGIYIQKISDKYHLARNKVESYNVSTHHSVLSSATHALTLKGWHVPNTTRMLSFNVLSKPQAYPLDLINKFFGAFRIASNIDTGYTQIYASAVGWCAHCKADLPYVEGATIRSYPSWFEDYYWNSERIPKISIKDMEIISALYNKLIVANENSIDLALKRLNRCLIRDSEEDSVLDATIALEALLSDDGNQEMTHKLAMRVGALSRLCPDFGKSAQQAFRDIKNIYSYRSAIVHGSKSLDKKRVIKVDGDTKATAHSLAVEYLRMLLKTLLEHPEYRDPKKIDSDLLLGRSTEA